MEKVKDMEIKMDHRYLFRSDSCYPLSPVNQDGTDVEVSSEDLVIKMISILRDIDTSFILSEVKLTYVQELEQNK
jgi:hypothetical protein